MTLDSTFLPLARRLIDEFGKVVTFESAPIPGEYNRETGKTTPSSKTTHTAKVSPPDKYKKFFIDGDVIKASDTKVLVANEGNDFIPDNGWAVTIDGQCWKVINVTPFYSGELIAAWELQLRR